MSKITAIMSVYADNKAESYAKWFNMAVDHVLSQSFEDFKFIIVSDGDPLFLREHIDAINDKRVEVLYREHEGFTKQLNYILFNKCDTEYVIRCDSDDICQKDLFKQEYEFLSQNEKYGACGCSYILIDSVGKKIRSVHMIDPEIKRNLPELAGIMPGSATMIRAKAIKEVGGWPNYRYAQDFALWVIFRKSGWLMANVKDCLYYWRQHEFQISMYHKDEQRACHEAIVRDLCK